MDIYCPKCDEPWDTDELHYVEDPTKVDADGYPAIMPYDEARKAFRAKGCEIFGTSHGELRTDDDDDSELSPGQATAIAMDLLGDDLDGVASILDDYL
jgi:hypothetical protein